MKRDVLADQILAAINMVYPEGSGLHDPFLNSGNIRDVERVIESTMVSTYGSCVAEFEAELARWSGVPDVLALSSGTSALHLSLHCGGVKPKDEVLVPALTFVGSVNPIRYCGATPHFVEVDEKSLGIDPTKLEVHLRKNAIFDGRKTINKKTRKHISAMVLVHLLGRPAAAKQLLALCNRYNITLIEDAAEALGTTIDGKQVGTFGRFGILSFNGNKILTTGSGGALYARNPEDINSARHLARTAKLPHKYLYNHDEVGFNYGMSALNAALGVGQLKRFEQILKTKMMIHEKYARAFEGSSDMAFVSGKKLSMGNTWLNAVKLNDDDVDLRDYVLEKLANLGKQVRPIWSLVSSLGPFLSTPRMDLTISKKISTTMICLPSGSGANLQCSDNN